MAYRIATPGEKLKLDLSGLTGEEKGCAGFVIYSRLLAGTRKDLVKKHAVGKSTNPGDWPAENQEAFLNGVLSACFQGTEGVLGVDGAERSMTLQEALDQPEDFKAFLFNHFVTSSTKGVEALGN